MIRIGLTGWGDHDSLYTERVSNRDKLLEYGAHFPTVEVDASFYAVQPERNAEKWVRETPESFKFVVKAYQGMTGHQRGEIPFESKLEMFTAFKSSLTPYLRKNKLAMVLFQFPPWFNCKKENVQYLRWCKQQMGELPCALEFRHQSWYEEAFIEGTLKFIKEEGWIHTVCDEPQAGEGSVPLIMDTCGNSSVLVRFHGRNVHGWQNKQQPNWREVRYLYRYNKQELLEWAERLKELQREAKEVYVLFNNNSGGDAADNAKEMLHMLGIEYEGLAPKQLGLF